MQCLVRDKAVSASPEESVRQRILNYLINVKRWPKALIDLEASYAWVGDAQRDRIRPDIELCTERQGDLKSVAVVVECKAPHVLLGEGVFRQAVEYASKSDAQYIWLTNGEEHRFFKFKKRTAIEAWKPTNKLEPLDVASPPPDLEIGFPGNPADDRDVDRYFSNFERWCWYENDERDRKLVLAIHKLLYGIPKRRHLPFSLGGVHILEDRGFNLHEFGNAGGGRWRNLYSDYIAATSGRVEALSVAVTGWGGKRGGLRLCVGVRKSNRSHHALQMDCQHIEWDSRRSLWHVYHRGRLMSQVRNETVLAAVRESGAASWIDDDGGILLGQLYPAERGDWRNSKKLLANLLHYGIIRTNLRDAEQQRRREG
ncbi:MAG: type I restriction enzyme HsdR N-terminal domain-containing protein [Gammaproteobacteria bacterium]|nr:type I restriction enzyme HsdR N-terminal domain-containing protein [Gammaproteobacteria bacterium]